VILITNRLLIYFTDEEDGEGEEEEEGDD